MEITTKYYPKESLVIRVVFFFLVCSFIACGGSRKVTSNDDGYKLINKELGNLGLKGNVSNIFLSKKLSTSLLDYFSDLEFSEKYYEYHFLYTFYSLSKKEFKTLFNEKQIENYKKQIRIYNRKYIDSSKVKNKKLKIINNDNKTGFYNDKGLVVVSYPVFTKEGGYAVMSYYIGDYILNSGSSGIAIYKKENKKWVLFRRILMGMG